MGYLREFHDCKIDVDLMVLADYIEAAGISCTVPAADDGSVSLSLALARVCGSNALTFVDDFGFWLDSVPAANRSHFVLCWDALELECEGDIVEWSELHGTEATVAMIRRLAKEIQYFTTIS